MMARIARRAIGPHRRPRPHRRTIVRIETVMALGAHRAKLAQAEEFIIAAMRHHVVGYRRRRHAVGLQANLAKRLKPQLMPPPALPFTPIVPTMDMTFVRHRHLLLTFWIKPPLARKRR
jgi:hypothetical protein